MIDLHCHILPGLDDGAGDLKASLDMAQLLVADGVDVVVCTPHILPGLYHNSGPQIREAVRHLDLALRLAGLDLDLRCGSDAHITPDFVAGLKNGHILSLADSRYVLVEPPHHVAPARLEQFFFEILVAGYVPIFTHPERMTWIGAHYEGIRRLVRAGAWMQITAGSLTGDFGREPRYWAERMLDEGLVHLLASDAHDPHQRPPNLSKGWEAAAKRAGEVEAEHLVLTRPRGVIHNEVPSLIPLPFAVGSAGRSRRA